MAILSILQFGDSRLARHARTLSTDEIRSPQVQELIADMFETLEASGGVGLSAIQVGVGVRLFVMHLSREAWERISDHRRITRGIVPIPKTVRANAEIDYSAKNVMVIGSVEGCTSYPGYMGPVKRISPITVSALDENSDPIMEELAGWPACVVQHEHEHSIGRFYMDSVPPGLVLPIDRAREMFDRMSSNQILALLAEHGY
jgi:peptide deformylase